MLCVPLLWVAACADGGDGAVLDATPDTGIDAGTDAGEPTDAGSDAGTPGDAGRDAGATDAAIDAAPTDAGGPPMCAPCSLDSQCGEDARCITPPSGPWVCLAVCDDARPCPDDLVCADGYGGREGIAVCVPDEDASQPCPCTGEDCPKAIRFGRRTRVPDSNDEPADDDGGDPFDESCSEAAVHDFALRAGDRIDAIQLQCSTLNVEPTADGSFLVRLGERLPGTRFGGGGGSAATPTCGDNEVVIGFFGSTYDGRDKISSLGFECAQLALDSDAAPPAVRVEYLADTTFHGTGPESFRYRCPDGAIAVGIVGRSGSRLDNLQLRCAQVLPDGF